MGGHRVVAGGDYRENLAIIHFSSAAVVRVLATNQVVAGIFASRGYIESQKGLFPALALFPRSRSLLSTGSLPGRAAVCIGPYRSHGERMNQDEWRVKSWCMEPAYALRRRAGKPDTEIRPVTRCDRTGGSTDVGDTEILFQWRPRPRRKAAEVAASCAALVDRGLGTGSIDSTLAMTGVTP